MDKLIQILQLGIFEGFVWFPFVLAIGIIYTYLKEIDVSIDGLIVISSVIFVVAFNSIESFLGSLLLTIIVAVALYSFVHIIISKFGVNSLLTGIIVSLILHSISVIVIGESLRLNYELLPVSLDNKFVFFVSLLIAASIYAFLKSKLGLKILITAGYKHFNSSLSFFNTRLIIYMIAGILVAVGSVVYSSRLGMSRAGGGFEFLITSLCSFLIIEKLVNYLKFENKISSILNSVVFKSLIGSIVFQIIVFAIIAYLSNAVYWKLLFGFILLLLVSDFSTIRNQFKRRRNPNSDESNLQVTNLTFSYAGSEQPIFDNFSLTFQNGINILWGPNGSGKSTLLSLINGTLESFSGTITYRNSCIKITQNKIFFLRQNAFENIGTDFTLQSNVIASSVSQKLQKEFYQSKISIDRNILGSSLSGGQAQKFSMDLCQVFQPLIVLADEPTSGLDNISFSKFIDFLNIQKKTADIIIVTHDERFKGFPANHINLDKTN